MREFRVTDALLILVYLAIGFLVGRALVKADVEIKYIKGDTVYDTITVPGPIVEKEPVKPILPVKRDTIYLPGEPERIIESVDTAEIIRQYVLERQYAFTVFDNKEYGKLDINQTIQYNKLQHFDYSFTPIIRVERTIQRKLFTPYLSLGGFYLGDIRAATLGGGIYINNLGLDYRYIYSDYSKGHMFGLNYKF